jgi:hypothetical protein
MISRLQFFLKFHSIWLYNFLQISTTVNFILNLEWPDTNLVYKLLVY